jgi:hypothetical protein
MSAIDAFLFVTGDSAILADDYRPPEGHYAQFLNRFGRRTPLVVAGRGVALRLRIP